jgi:hypothetical protein
MTGLVERLEEVIRSYVGDCSCHEAYRIRNLRDPQCVSCDVDPHGLALELEKVVAEHLAVIGAKE